jgi:hypothetical protein
MELFEGLATQRPCLKENTNVSWIQETFVWSKLSKKIIYKWSCLKVGLQKGHAWRTTPTFLESKRHSFSPNFVNLLNRNWSSPMVVQHKSHALSLLKMSVRSKRHLSQKFKKR